MYLPHPGIFVNPSACNFEMFEFCVELIVSVFDLLVQQLKPTQRQENLLSLTDSLLPHRLVLLPRPAALNMERNN